MRLFINFSVFILLSANIINGLPADDDKKLQPYTKVLQEQGEEPINFITTLFQNYHLLIFDDALHTAVEPFDFYQKLINTPSFFNQVKYVFIEVFPLNKQHYIDSYLESVPENKELLYPAFQDDVNGTGWSYKTYFDLLHTIYTLNKTLPKDDRLKVICVSNPTYWPEIKTIRDFELFQKSLRSYDYVMYKMISMELDNFESNKKGVFLTNTRHAYKGIKNKKNDLYWNTATFFHQWHPGKTFSVRLHNLQLILERNETITFLWERIGGGIWDSAFEVLGNKPIAIPLKDNIFGKESYVGNHMLNAAPNQTFFDAYDALIFLGPLEKMHKTAIVDFIYTTEFKAELERRYPILFTEEQLNKQFDENNVNTLKQLIGKITIAEPQKLLPQAKMIGPIDAWKNE